MVRRGMNPIIPLRTILRKSYIKIIGVSPYLYMPVLSVVQDNDSLDTKNKCIY